jgi:hypothetical protein
MLGEITGEMIKNAMARNITKNITLKNKASYKIYKEQTVQGFSKPSFFIWTMDVDQTKQMRNNYERNYMMNVRFHTKDDAPKQYEELNDIGNKLLWALSILNVPILVLDETNKQIEVNKPIKGKQMSFNIVEGVLQVYVTYTIKAKQVLAKTPEMQVLDIKDI